MPPVPPTEELSLSSLTRDAVVALARAASPTDAAASASRLDAWDRWAAAPLPSAAREDWRYSRIDDLDLDRYHLAGGAPGPLGPPPAVVEQLCGALGAHSTVVVVRNGRELSVAGAASGVRVEREPVAAEELLVERAEGDPFADLNTALSATPVTVHVEGEGSGPVAVVHWVDEAGAAVFPRLRVVVAGRSAGAVLEVVASADADCLVVPVTELVVADGARLGYVGVQVLGSPAWQLGTQVSTVGRDATLSAATVALGGGYARLRTVSALEGEGGTSRLLAGYFAAGSQMHDFRTVQAHRRPRATSDLRYKGVVANRAQAVYTGLIRVEKGARGTNAQQTNRNLVLHEGAHADSVPNLEIEDNDVRCSHASAVGPIAEDQRFYLESRGVPPAAADRLIALGFLDEVLGALPLPEVAPVLREELASKLARAEEAELASEVGR